MSTEIINLTVYMGNGQSPAPRDRIPSRHNVPGLNAPLLGKNVPWSGQSAPCTAFDRGHALILIETDEEYSIQEDSTVLSILQFDYKVLQT